MTSEDLYQPPKAEIRSPQFSEQRLNRPASTKWVLFFATLFAGMVVWVYIKKGFSIEWWKWQREQPWRIAFQLYLLLSWIVLCSSYPRKLAYTCGVIHCIILTIAMTFTGLHELTSKPISWTNNDDRATLIVFPFFMGLSIWLLYRFTFGLPSRRYYGIGSAKNDSEPSNEANSHHQV